MTLLLTCEFELMLGYRVLESNKEHEEAAAAS
jgi:hypothetical protein